MGRVVIVAYKPKTGRERDLEVLARRHLEILRKENLVTDRDAILLRASDGTIVEVFEWQSKEAIDRAHANEAVQEMWRAYAAVCDYVPIATVPEAQTVFSESAPLD